MLIDTPGNQKYMKNTMRGIGLTDAAIVVVDALKDPKNDIVGLDKTKRAKDSAICAQASGIKQFMVAVNIFRHIKT